MAATATVTNTSRQLVQLILDHPAFFNKQAGWQRTTVSFAATNENGERQISEIRRSYPATISILPGESVADLHPAVLNCSQVPSLVARRVLTVQITEEKKAP